MSDIKNTKNNLNQDLTVVILGAGKGTRMNSSLPKAMHILGGVPMIDHLLYKAKQLNPHQIISVIAKNMQSLHDHIIDQCDIVYQDKRLGSAHAVYTTKYAHSSKNGVTLVLYADTPLVNVQQLQELVGKIRQQNHDLCILAFEKEEENRYGKLIVDDDGQVLEIVEDSEATDEQKKILLCNSGVMAIRTDIIWDLLSEVDNENSQKEYYLTDIVAIARKKEISCSYVIDEEVNLQGANSKIELADLEMAFQDQKRMEFLEAGVQLIDPQTVYFSLDTKISQDVVIYPNVHILKNTEIKSGAIIYPFSVIEGAIIGEKSNIGPFARLRTGTNLFGKNNIGNFVEIKKSEIKEGVKINHLSYIGDTYIGEKTNIGAGTITCNYDGKNKHATKIGENCFIGSNSSLVAPVIIEDGALVGAGSVITKFVDKDTLALTRAPQKSFPRKK